MDILFLIIGLFLGLSLGWFVAKSKFQNSNNNAEKSDQLLELQTKLAIAEERSQNLLKDSEKLKLDLENSRSENQNLQNQLTRTETEYRNIQKRLEEQKTELTELNEKFAAEFKNLANEIFEEKSKKFTDQNKTNLGELLNPLKERIGEFQKKVEDTNKENLERNASLVQQIKTLGDLNKQITKEAENLTKALKGDSKQQGNWGEVILERILEKSGLEKGREYETQVSESNEEGKVFRPDVVVRLPDSKNIIIDSKVSLTAYERYSNLELEEEKLANLKLHINSIRAHVKGLGEKNYQNLYGIDGLDFVLLFIPIEPAFTLAVQHDPELFNDAYLKNIVIVSPSTLIATLRTISSIWKQEYQNKNALEIARQGGALYDKFVSFVEDLKNIGKHLESSQKVYRESMKKLYDGNGNLVKRAENIKKLGAKTSKQIDQKLLDRSEENVPSN
tara:strand:- start:3286 stop:4629 length:1344 start_codon:yes stop_codon:yes gene_type:complete